MRRRVALKQIGLGVSAGIVLPSWLTACSSDGDPKPNVPNDAQVVIIGAGAAGLYAADILQTKGIKVTILEASNRVGGRVSGRLDWFAGKGIKAADGVGPKTIGELYSSEGMPLSDHDAITLDFSLA